MPVVSLSLDSRDSIKGLKDYDSAVDRSAANTDTSFAKMKSNFGEVAVAVGAMATAVVTAFVAFGVSSLDAASRMQETQNKYDVVFKGMETTANAWAKTLQDDYDMSELASKKYLSSTKFILDATGMQSNAAGELSNKMVQLSLDMASLSDVKPEEAVRAMTSALTGEYESLKSLGIVINADEVATKAMTSNRLVSASSVTQAMKAESAYQLILQKSGVAHGDVARSAGSYVRELNRLKASYEDLQTQVGGQLLPLASQVLVMFNQWSKSTDIVGGSASNFNTVLSAVISTVRFLHNGLLGVIQVGNLLVMAFAKVSSLVAEGLQHIINPLNLLGEKLVQFGVLAENPFGGVIEGINKLRDNLDTFRDSSIATFDAHIQKIVETNQMYDSFIATVEKAGAAKEKDTAETEASKKALEEWTNQAYQGKAAAHEYGNALDIVRSSTDAYTKVATSAKDMTSEQAAKFTELYSKLQAANKAVADQAVALKSNATPAAQQYYESLVKLAEVAQKNVDEFGKVKEATEKVSTSSDAAGESAAKTTSRFHEMSEGARAAGQSFSDLESEFSRMSDSFDERSSQTSNPFQSSGQFSARGGLTEEQWQSLPKAAQDTLVKQGIQGNSLKYYFNAGSYPGSRNGEFVGTDSQTSINARAQMAYDWQQLLNRNTVTVTNNFNQQLSRSDITSIMEESQRATARA